MPSANLIGDICSAIAKQEGFFEPNSIARVNRNPGNIRSAAWLNEPFERGGFWVAATVAQGIAGLYHEVALKIARGMTLRELINSWAPASDGNQPDVYLRNVMQWAGILTPDIPLQAYLSLVDPTVPPKKAPGVAS